MQSALLRALWSVEEEEEEEVLFKAVIKKQHTYDICTYVYQPDHIRV